MNRATRLGDLPMRSSRVRGPCGSPGTPAGDLTRAWIVAQELMRGETRAWSPHLATPPSAAAGHPSCCECAARARHRVGWSRSPGTAVRASRREWLSTVADAAACTSGEALIATLEPDGLEQRQG